ncbi:lysophospholipase [Luteolibacter flavescens]|uniref:Lysophospholipase n=1 Tax=Luteolibacter flavescens TaxID=1859460 RepID=A0ABT3FU36_9BACT|nr:lysophospholipase [Luteolibacter flavescens]MCW1887078.1 lysophospholipase [Luteolibacter flavescens]
MKRISSRAGGSRARTAARLGALLLAPLLLTQCATNYALVADRPEEAVRNETFGYRKWMSAKAEPETVVIGVHGFCGASIDYENLGKRLLKDRPDMAVYAYEVRGQGKDPLKERRGDIDDPELWFSDLAKFSAMVRTKHPDARIVWFGESMGALIVSHAYEQAVAAGEKPPCDAIVLSSPVVKFREDFPKWKKDLVHGIAGVIPTARVSLETMAGGQQVQMTHDTVHSQQAETNSWHIDRHTLRLLVALSDLIDGMPDCARTFSVPTLVLHGGKDFFSSESDVKAFYGNVPKEANRTYKHYPESYHLLMYDDQKDKVIGDVEKWLARLPEAKH